MKIEILDTTLRDGGQGAGVGFSNDDRLNVIDALDRLGVSYIEAGMITDEGTAAFFESLADVSARLKNAKLAAFTQTCRVGERPEESEILRMTANAPVPVAVIYGKAWLYQVSDVLGTNGEENLRIIRDSVRYLAECGKEVIFDAEHFFDGYALSPDYAVSVVGEAFEAGASGVVLCDTNGGMLPDVIGLVTEAVCQRFEGRKIGIHCHNDLGMAAASTVSAVLSGACHVQGTVSGIGERCGNANLNTVIPVLQLKLGFDCIGGSLKSLTKTARTVNEAANLSFSENEPFVGGYAFTHKAGAHIDGVTKTPKSFEHIEPEAVGNERSIAVSGLSGRAAVIDRLKLAYPDETFTKSDERVIGAAALIRSREEAGYDYENADASLTLLLDETLGRRRHFFDLLLLKVNVDESARKDDGDILTAFATIKISVDGKEYLTAGEGNGPVNAIDGALRRAIGKFYPEVENMKLTDYRVRVLDSKATASSVRVAIRSTDGTSSWSTVGVSEDVINASWQALRDSVEFMLRKNKE